MKYQNISFSDEFTTEITGDILCINYYLFKQNPPYSTGNKGYKPPTSSRRRYLDIPLVN